MQHSFKPILFLLIFFLTSISVDIYSQCTNASQFGTINAPTNNSPTTITTCAFGGEYSTINSAVAGRTYLFSATGGAGNFLTIRQGTPGGTVLGFGFSPVSVTCTVSGPLYLHYNTTAACGTDGSCHTGVIQCTSCLGAPDPCTSISSISCATPTTANLIGAGLWSVTACGFSTPGSEKVYSFTPAVTGTYSLQVNTTNSGGYIDYYYKVASGGCSSSGWTCIDDILSPSTVTIGTLTAGTAYYLLLDAETTSNVIHTFQINCPSVPVVLTCPTNTTAAACQSQAAVNAQFAAWLATASATGGCNGVLTNNNTGAPSACGGSTTVTFTYTSTCAPLTTTCQATFTVAASPTVVLTCPINTTAAVGQTQAAVNAQFATWLNSVSASGGCNGSLSNNNVGAPPATGGSTTVTFTYTNTCAPLITTCQATFAVSASPPVVLTCPTNTTAASCQTQAAVNTAFATWLATASGSGGCNGVLSNNNTGAPPACGGSTTVTFTYTSTCAPLTTTCQATFTVAAAPTVVLTCPINTTVASCQTQAVVNTQFNAWLATASASGGCNGILSNNNTGAPGFTGGTTTVTFTRSSSCAPTTTTCQATFTVAPDLAPTITCPANIIRNVDPGLCSAVVPYTAPVGNDNCPNPTTVQIAGVPPNTVVNVGPATTNVFRVTDSNGSTATCSFTITVVDNIAPTIVCPPNVTLSVDAATCTKMVTYTSPLGTDNCPNPVTTQIAGFASGAILSPGAYVNTFRVTDAAGNSSTCSFTTTIQGNIPVITCPGIIIVNNTQGMCGAFVNYAATVQSNLFPPATITYSIPSGSFFQPGYTQVTATATNSCGSSSCTFGVIVNIGPDPELAAAYTIIANNYVGLNGSMVNSGGVGTHSSLGTVEVEGGSTVSGGLTFVKTPNLYISNNSTVQNPLPGNVNYSILPPYPYSSGPTYNNISIPDNATVTLTLNSYGDIKIGNNATVIFGGNTNVKVKQIISGIGARINFRQNTSLLVKGAVTLGRNTSVNVGSGNLITMYVDANATVAEGCRVNANIYTLRYLIASGGLTKTEMTGLFIGHQVNSEQNVVWNRNANNCQISTGSRPSDITEDSQDLSALDLRNEKESSFTVYPNPAVDQIRIDYLLNADITNVSFWIYDTNGRKVGGQKLETVNGDSQSFNFDVNHLPAGVYQISMETESKSIQSHRIIIIK